MLKDLNKIENLKSDCEDNECIMCRQDKYLVNIEKLPHIIKTLEELSQDQIKKICLNCIFILDVRYTIKEKICFKYVSTCLLILVSKYIK